jgi:hypothetical protein
MSPPTNSFSERTPVGKIARYGTIDWLFRQYKTQKAYTEKVSPRSRPDYERIMQMICDTVGKSGRRIGERQSREVTRRAADKIYDKIINGPNGLRLRQGEKVVGLCRKVWRIMHRLHPELFDRKHPNPWDDFTLKSRTYRGYAKETMQRALAATRKRHAHLLAQGQVENQNTDTAPNTTVQQRGNESSTEFPNGGSNPFPKCAQKFGWEESYFSNEFSALTPGWGGRDRTSEWRNQNPLPYRLATPQQAGSGIQSPPPPRRSTDGGRPFQQARGPNSNRTDAPLPHYMKYEALLPVGRSRAPPNFARKRH